MKSTLIRIFAIMTLATSISAVAQPKKDTENTNCSTTSETTTAPESKTDNGQEKSGKQRLIEEQDKQWLHDVQNIVAG